MQRPIYTVTFLPMKLSGTPPLKITLSILNVLCRTQAKFPSTFNTRRRSVLLDTAQWARIPRYTGSAALLIMFLLSWLYKPGSTLHCTIHTLYTTLNVQLHASSHIAWRFLRSRLCLTEAIVIQYLNPAFADVDFFCERRLYPRKGYIWGTARCLKTLHNPLVETVSLSPRNSLLNGFFMFNCSISGTSS